MTQKCLLVFFTLFITLASCDKMNKTAQEKPVARVYDTYLYPSDLRTSVPEGLLPEDSIRIARRLIEDWVRDKLLLISAEQYLSEEQKNVEKQIEEYRSSLLTFKYKQKLLSQNLDTVVTDQELQSYYDQYSSNYILDNDVVKVNYVKVSVDAPEISNVRRWFKSERPEDLDKLEKYCATYASNYMINGEQWLKFENLIDATPHKITNPTNYLNINKNIEINDSTFYYFIHIIDRVQEGQVSPLSLIKDDIKSVIINKRKIRFMDELENTIYQDSRAKNKVEIY